MARRYFLQSHKHDSAISFSHSLPHCYLCFGCLRLQHLIIIRGIAHFDDMVFVYAHTYSSSLTWNLTCDEEILRRPNANSNMPVSRCVTYSPRNERRKKRYFARLLFIDSNANDKNRFATIKMTHFCRAGFLFHSLFVSLFYIHTTLTHTHSFCIISVVINL